VIAAILGDTPHGLCDCCSRIIRDGKPGRAPARYAWTGQLGYTHLLCVYCCALWRQNVLQDPELAPLSIRELAVL
jgi:hypothetical protein